MNRLHHCLMPPAYGWGHNNAITLVLVLLILYKSTILFTKKMLHLSKRLTDLHKIWHNDAKWVPWLLWLLRTLNIKIQRWRMATILKSHYVAISPQPFDRFWRNMQRSNIKISNFCKSKTATANNNKVDKLQYIWAMDAPISTKIATLWRLAS